MIVNAAVGAVFWSGYAALIWYSENRFHPPPVVAYAVCGAGLGLLAALTGQWVARLMGRSRLWDLPIGGAIVTVILLAVLGAAELWHRPSHMSADTIPYVVFLAGFFLSLGAAAGFVAGVLAVPISHGLFQIADRFARGGQSRESG
jgi:uncharacterized membrane protein YfcA